MTHREARKLFVNALYEEWSDAPRQEFEDHLASCSDCRSGLDDLRSVARTMQRRERPQLSKVEWTIFWNELAARMNEGDQRKSILSAFTNIVARFFRLQPVLSYGAAVVSILVIGIVLGKLAFTGPNLDLGKLTEHLSNAEKSILDERAQNYLQRSKILLLGIVNGSEVTPSSAQITKQQEVSRVLVSEAGPLKSELTEADQQRMKKLVGDLEVILLQIANLETAKDYPALEIVKQGVEQNGLLLKINLEQMQAQKAPPAAQKASPATKSKQSSSSSI